AARLANKTPSKGANGALSGSTASEGERSGSSSPNVKLVVSFPPVPPHKIAWCSAPGKTNAVRTGDHASAPADRPVSPAMPATSEVTDNRQQRGWNISGTLI